MSEHQQQAAVIDWFRKQYPKIEGCLWAIPNGAILAGNKQQRARQMNYLKAEGFKPGVSDLFLMVSSGEYNGLFIEMKDKGKKEKDVSIPQWEHIHLAREQGYKAEWCAGFDEAKKVITEYLNL